MGTSSKRWSALDPKYYEGCSLKELQRKLQEAIAFAEEYKEFEFGWHNEYRQELRRRIAEMIGKKDKNRK